MKNSTTGRFPCGSAPFFCLTRADSEYEDGPATIGTMESVYIETTVIGSIAGRLHPDPRISVRQQATREWWSAASDRYRLFTSSLTLDECEAGDPVAAAERLAIIRHIPAIQTSEPVVQLAKRLTAARAVPDSQPRDAFHISLAAVHSIEFLVTWNFKHILNPHLQKRISDVCREAGYRPSAICTPQQLMESDRDS